MKKFSLIALSLVASTVVLSGCGEKKIEPNNYYCTLPSLRLLKFLSAIKQHRNRLEGIGLAFY